MKITTLLTFIAFLLCFQVTYAETVNVGLEPLPPFVEEDGTGLTIQLLKEAEKISDLKFNITIMPYSRAKKSLKNKKINLMGHTPYKLEEKSFFEYAVEVEWSQPTYTDLYAVKNENLNAAQLKKLERIGTLFGNSDFFSELFDLPKAHFHEAKMENLLIMLDKGRLDGILFERAATMSSISKAGLEHKVYYKTLANIPVGLAVPKDSKGNALKQKLESLLQKIDQEKIFKEYLHYAKLPDEGVVE